MGVINALSPAQDSPGAASRQASLILGLPAAVTFSGALVGDGAVYLRHASQGDVPTLLGETLPCVSLPWRDAALCFPPAIHTRRGLLLSRMP